MKKSISYLVLFFIPCFLLAQDYSSTIVEGAERFTKAKKIGRYNLAVDMMHPDLVEKGGGKESMVKIIKSEQEMFDVQGFTIIETTTLLPLEIVSTEKNMHCLVPQLTIIQLGEAKFNSKRYILASSPDKGENWYYLNLEAYNDNSIKIFFPEWNDQLKIPEPEPAVMIED